MHTALPPRPSSPWPGSTRSVRHRWQLDGVRTLGQAAACLRDLADELTEAHAAGWWLTEPVRNGHLLSQRASRRQRPPRPVAPARAEQAPPLSTVWRLRLVDEPPVPGDDVLDLGAATAASVLRWDGNRLSQTAGPPVDDGLLAELQRQVAVTGLDSRPWALAAARVGPAHDLIAEGSALRLHAVNSGRLVRTAEALSFTHAADGASTLLAAAAAYRRLADHVDLMTARGARLTEVDDGLLHVAYGTCPNSQEEQSW